jgi:hypothetical protein
VKTEKRGGVWPDKAKYEWGKKIYEWPEWAKHFIEWLKCVYEQSKHMVDRRKPGEAEQYQLIAIYEQ